MRRLVCFLEERSAQAMLEAVLPRIIGDTVQIQYKPYDGKNDLDNNLERALRCWKTPDTVFLVLRDQDQGDCQEIKMKLLHKVVAARRESVTLVRIACRELESFYLGDLEAVAAGLKLRNPAGRQAASRYRDPDSMVKPSEELKRLSGGSYQKIAGSRAIAPLLKLDGSNRSRSFNMLLVGLRRLVGEEA